MNTTPITLSLTLTGQLTIDPQNLEQLSLACTPKPKSISAGDSHRPQTTSPTRLHDKGGRRDFRNVTPHNLQTHYPWFVEILLCDPDQNNFTD